MAKAEILILQKLIDRRESINKEGNIEDTLFAGTTTTFTHIYPLLILALPRSLEPFFPPFFLVSPLAHYHYWPARPTESTGAP